MLAGLFAAALLEPQRIDLRRQCGWLLPPAWIVQKEPGGFISYVGVPHGVELDGAELFYTHVHLHGGPAPVRRYLPRLIELVLNGSIKPCCVPADTGGHVFSALPVAKDVFEKRPR